MLLGLGSGDIKLLKCIKINPMRLILKHAYSLSQITLCYVLNRLAWVVNFSNTTRGRGSEGNREKEAKKYAVRHSVFV